MTKKSTAKRFDPKNPPKKKSPTKDRGEQSTDGLDVPIAHRQMLLANGQWEPRMPAAVKKHLLEYDKLDANIKALTKKRTAAKANLIDAAKKSGALKLRIGQEFLHIKPGADVIEREKIPVEKHKKKKTKKKAAKKKATTRRS